MASFRLQGSRLFMKNYLQAQKSLSPFVHNQRLIRPYWIPSGLKSSGSTPPIRWKSISSQRYSSSAVSSPHPFDPQAGHKLYHPVDIQHMLPQGGHLPPQRLLIDVREPEELNQTGWIPGAVSMPIQSNPDAFVLDDADFSDRFGWLKPKPKSKTSAVNPSMADPSEKKAFSASATDDNSSIKGTSDVDKAMQEYESQDGQVEEVIFYCKAGVRSKAAARMAEAWKGIKIGEMTGGFDQYLKKKKMAQVQTR